MKKYFKNILLVLILTLSFFIVGCEKKKEEPVEEEPDHVCIPSDWIEDVPFTCGETGVQYKECIICHKELESRRITKHHEFEETIIQPTCTENGKKIQICKNCGKRFEMPIPAIGHKLKISIAKGATSTSPMQRNVVCSNCGEVFKTLDYANNGYEVNGKLNVKGRDLVNKIGRPMQLYGLSTHGIQWFSRFINFDTIANLQSAFGMNVIRFAFYTDEDGYCDGSDSRKKGMLINLKKGIDIATKLGLYVIIDWHMVGASNDADKNPLTYLEESKQFFSDISYEYRFQDNILYEIMNEPNGSTTWADCKKYAEEVIPCIRKNSDGIILVGNPSWTADLNSVMRDPLDTNKYKNIMYTYHFYAADRMNTSYQVQTAYDKGFPVFISEFGFMDSAGHGELDLEAGNAWMEQLNKRNISYSAWNISDTQYSASIFKHNTPDITDVSDDNLQEWGILLKKMYRHNSGLDKYDK